MSLEIKPSGQVCGAEVRGVDLCADLDDATVAEIRAGWLKHRVLAFPDQPMTNDDLERFTLRFGPFGDDTFFGAIDDHPNIAAVHRRADETAPVFALSWHADWSFQQFPPDGTCLFAKIVPPVGGDTLFVDQVAALAAMPAELRDRIEEIEVVHSARGGYAPDGLYGKGDEGSNRAMKIVYSDKAYETQNHRLVQTHAETGERTLYGTIGYIIDVEDMEQNAAAELLGQVYAWQTRDEFIYTHQWEQNMLVCLLYTSPSPRDATLSRMPSSA